MNLFWREIFIAIGTVLPILFRNIYKMHFNSLYDKTNRAVCALFKYVNSTISAELKFFFPIVLCQFFLKLGNCFLKFRNAVCLFLIILFTFFSGMQTLGIDMTENGPRHSEKSENSSGTGKNGSYGLIPHFIVFHIYFMALMIFLFLIGHDTCYSRLSLQSIEKTLSNIESELRNSNKRKP